MIDACKAAESPGKGPTEREWKTAVGSISSMSRSREKKGKNRRGQEGTREAERQRGGGPTGKQTTKKMKASSVSPFHFVAERAAH